MEAFAAVQPGEADPLRRLTAAVRAFEDGQPPADDIAAMRLAIFDVSGQGWSRCDPAVTKLSH